MLIKGSLHAIFSQGQAQESNHVMNCHSKWVEDLSKLHAAEFCSANHSKNTAEKHWPWTCYIPWMNMSRNTVSRIRAVAESFKSLCAAVQVQGAGGIGSSGQAKGAPPLHVRTTYSLFHFFLHRHPWQFTDKSCAPGQGKCWSWNTDGFICKVTIPLKKTQNGCGWILSI